MAEVETTNYSSSETKNNAVNNVLEELADSSINKIDVSISSNESWDEVDIYVKTANAKILLNTLAPEVSKNEETKREHKEKLIKYVSIFLGVQFLIVFVFAMTVLVSIIVFHAVENDFSLGLIEMLFAFFGTYITAVVVELICILKYIVLNVFDTSISGLMEVFKFGNDKKKEDKKKHGRHKKRNKGSN